MKSQGFGAEKIVSGGRYIALEGIQDPSNLGAIARTAEALGIDGMEMWRWLLTAIQRIIVASATENQTVDAVEGVDN
jgi:tRNA G18 (ribose-2'-O)-methylase SpoU